jgi:hypothetical protein
MQNGPVTNISRLAKTQKGKLKTALRCVFYGPEGVGKTTLASYSPEPIWLDIEDGSSRLNVARYQWRDEVGGHVPRTYADVLAAVADLATNKHDYRTLVVDTIDRLEALIWAHMIERDKARVKGGVETIEDYGYGKGYNIAVDEWRAFCARLDHLRAMRGMHIVLIAHGHVKMFKNPEGDDYERYGLQVNEKAGGFLKGWADVVGFCRFDEGAGKLKGALKAKGWSTGKRYLNLTRTAAYDAKGRGGMPGELELDEANPWAPFQRAIDDADQLGVEALCSLIQAEVARIDDEAVTKKVAEALNKAIEKKDTEALNRYLQQLKRHEGKAVA